MSYISQNGRFFERETFGVTTVVAQIKMHTRVMCWAEPNEIMIWKLNAFIALLPKWQKVVRMSH